MYISDVIFRVNFTQCFLLKQENFVNEILFKTGQLLIFFFIHKIQKIFHLWYICCSR